MSATRFGMISDWMINGNINDFVEAHPDADRLGLVCFPQSIAVLTSLIIAKFPQLAGVAQGLIYIHSKGMIHGDLKGVRL